MGARIGSPLPWLQVKGGGFALRPTPFFEYVPFVINNMFMSTTVCVNNMFVSTTCLCQQQFVSTITCLCQQHVYVNNSLCQQQHVYVNNMLCQQKLNRTSLNTRPDKYCSKLCISGHFFMSMMWQYVTVNTKNTM